MLRRKRRWPMVLLCVLVVLAAAAGWLYQASNAVPAFYAEALKPSATTENQAGHDMKRNAAALAGDTLRGGRWRATFSDKQINGYLAVDLPEKHPDVLPPGIRDPRVSIRHGEASIGWRAEGRWPAVYSLVIVPYMAKPNVLAVRIRRIRAGAVPVPLGEVVDGLTLAARQANLRLQWQQIDGDPVALVELPTEYDAHQRLVLDSIELAEGAIIIAGHSETPPDDDDKSATSKIEKEIETEIEATRAADQSGTNDSRQR
ncbi:MAG: hypothetical protein K8T91_05465 [Planctomycetes bacterium]|nr:hypothetical protein [Planctomycetota bacterium]